MRHSQTLGWTGAVLVAASLLLSPRSRGAEQPLRPPSTPLVAINPNFSIWSAADHLTDDTPRHWTGRPHALASLIRIDGNAFRLMGPEPKDAPPLPQASLDVQPTRSIYEFEGAGVHVTLTFMTPSLPEDLEVLGRPVTYLTWQARAVDGAAHSVSVYASASSQLTVNAPQAAVEWARETMGPLIALKAGAAEQTLLRPAGDDTRINWGYAYLAAPSASAKAAVGADAALLKGFVDNGALPAADDARMPRPANDEQPVMALVMDFGNVAAQPVARHALIAYDEVYSINFLGRKLRPYWRRNGAGPSDLLQAAERDYASLVQRCEAFDRELMADMTKQGGERYARMCALAYRQALAGCGLAADSTGQPMFFAKENTSNGCIATVDVIYPAAPQFLLMGPAYAKALVAPSMVYSASARWKFPFAPHDVGTYPQATGQVYGGGETSTNEADMMPVEESANLIILCHAIAKMEGKPDFASKYWAQLTQWEAYLEKFGLDPENQLCTDDFMGHLAHNANLSVKAILAIASYGELCRMRGDVAAADKFLALAREDAKHWMEVAADGDHYRIAFDKPESWSQKYNLVWDKLLGLNVFPPEVAKKEVAYYLKVMQKYGVPLDSRTKLTKADWSVWSATLADNPTDFDAIVSPIYAYLNATTARVAFCDSYITDNPRSDGMHARPVIGGVFIKMLEDPALWKKWASRDTAKVGDYAPAPPPATIVEVVPTSQKGGIEWRYTTQRPAADWNKPAFDDGGWQRGPGGFGTRGTPGAVVGTVWRTPEIWLRRSVTLPAQLDPAQLQLFVYHDEDVEVYIDGVLAAKEAGYVNAYQPLEIRPGAWALLKPGATVILAVHCRQTAGGQGVDVGLSNVIEPKP